MLSELEIFRQAGLNKLRGTYLFGLVKIADRDCQKELTPDRWSLDIR